MAGEHFVVRQREVRLHGRKGSAIAEICEELPLSAASTALMLIVWLLGTGKNLVAQGRAPERRAPLRGLGLHQGWRHHAEP
jgi:hypothetical protein